MKDFLLSPIQAARVCVRSAFISSPAVVFQQRLCHNETEKMNYDTWRI